MTLTYGLKSNLKQFFCLTRSKIFPNRMLSIRIMNFSPRKEPPNRYLLKITNLLCTQVPRKALWYKNHVQESNHNSHGWKSIENLTRKKSNWVQIPTLERQE